MRKPARSLFALALLSLAGCAEDAPPVARLEVRPDSLRLPFPELQPVRLRWQPGAALEGFSGTPTVFVHLLDDGGEVVRTFDHPFPGRWRPGQTVEYELKVYQSALAPPLPGGSYRLTVGLAGEGKQRWPLAGVGEPVARREYLAARVEVPPPPANRKTGPRFTFSDDWMTPEPGGDRQVLSRRWLSGSGGLRIAGVRQPGYVWLVFRIPPPEVAENLAVEGGGLPAVKLEGTCGDYAATLSGPGEHQVELPVIDPPRSGQCRVVLTPNFRFGAAGTPPRSVSLESAAWAPTASRTKAAAAPLTAP